MDSEENYVDLVENEDQFWDELDDIVSTPCYTHDRIDDTLRTWLEVCQKHRGRKLIDQDVHLQSEDVVARCAYELLGSSLFEKHTDYVRRQLVFVLLQEDDPAILHLIVSFLISDGRQQEAVLEMMNEEGSFQRLMQLIREDTDDGMGLHRLLLELLYEMARIQTLSINDLTTIDDNFIIHLFRMIEGLSNDVHDPYHYPLIRVLLVLNEQYMVAQSEARVSPDSRTPILINRIIKTIAVQGIFYKTFGESIILLLNRESETPLQLLILKMLYLLFTTPTTQEYFYTNDLHVLVDILMRNLLDLPNDTDVPSSPTEADTKDSPASARVQGISLRHTYLRVLHPLIAHTQLRHPPHYKRDQLRSTLFVLADVGQHHFDQPDETIVRLVARCLSVDWLKDTDDEIESAGLLERAISTTDSSQADALTVNLTTPSPGPPLSNTTTATAPIPEPDPESEPEPATDTDRPDREPNQPISTSKRLAIMSLPAAQASQLSVVGLSAYALRDRDRDRDHPRKPASERPAPALPPPRRTRRKAVAPIAVSVATSVAVSASVSPTADGDEAGAGDGNENGNASGSALLTAGADGGGGGGERSPFEEEDAV